jgi:CYTH domain-containing protein
MHKTAPAEYQRLFLIERLPEPLTPASAHVQIFDNYIEGTRLRLRLVRDPSSRAWTRILQQKFPIDSNEPGVSKLAEIYLNEQEYEMFEQFEGREVRKNRYFHEFDRQQFTFDVHLGDLWGLNTARVDFQAAVEMQKFEPPPFAVFEITSDPFFRGENLVGRSFKDVRVRVAEIGANVPLSSAMPDE